MLIYPKQHICGFYNWIYEYGEIVVYSIGTVAILAATHSVRRPNHPQAVGFDLDTN